MRTFLLTLFASLALAVPASAHGGGEYTHPPVCEQHSYASASTYKHDGGEKDDSEDHYGDKDDDHGTKECPKPPVVVPPKAVEPPKPCDCPPIPCPAPAPTPPVQPQAQVVVVVVTAPVTKTAPKVKHRAKKHRRRGPSPHAKRVAAKHKHPVPHFAG